MKNRPIRILQCGMTNNCGGVESFIMNVYRKIDKSKIQFDFLTTHNGKIAYEEEIKQLGGRIFKVEYTKKENIIKHYSELKKFFKKYGKEFTAIHMNKCYPFYTLPLKYARKSGIKARIVHSHCSADMLKPNSIIKQFVRNIKALIAKKLIKYRATHLLACSKEAGRYLFTNTPFQIIENGIDTERFKFDKNKKENILNELNIKDKRVIGFVGKLREQKNPMFVLKVFKELYQREKKVCLLFVGTGELKNEMIQYIKKNNLEEVVYFAGLREDVSDFYSAMDVFFLPAIFEGLGIVLIEAQANGVSCVTSTGIPDETCVTDLVKRIDLKQPIEIWSNELLRCLSKQRNEEYNNIVKDKYGIDITVKKLEKIYLEGENSLCKI